VLDEAFQLGLPVIVSDRGALPDRVGASGERVTVGDVEALTQNLTRMIQDKERRGRFAEAVRSRAACVSMEQHLTELCKVYETVRSLQPSPPPGTFPYPELVTQKQKRIEERDRMLLQLNERLTLTQRDRDHLKKFKNKVERTLPYKIYRVFKKRKRAPAPASTNRPPAPARCRRPESSA
jgi:hypothetical protein